MRNCILLFTMTMFSKVRWVFIYLKARQRDAIQNVHLVGSSTSNPTIMFPDLCPRNDK